MSALPVLPEPVPVPVLVCATVYLVAGVLIVLRALPV